MAMAAKPAFVDTNVLVYASRMKSPFHPRATASLQRASDDGAPLWISRQIIREYLAVVTRPQPTEPALSIAEASADVERFLADLNVAEDGPDVTRTLLQLLAQFPSGGRLVHDVNIVSTMLAHGITRLLTFNEADFRRFESVIDIAVP